MIKRINKLLFVLIIAGNFLCQGLYMPGINTPIYLLMLVGLGALTLLYSISRTKLRACRLDMLVVFLLLNIFLVSLLNDRIDTGRLLLIFFSFTFMYAVKKIAESKEGIKFILKVYVIVVLISSLVAIGQSLGIEQCNELWRVLHTGDKLEDSLEAERYLGLASDVLQLGYHASTAFIITLFACPFRKKAVRYLLLIVFVFALIVNNTRSAWIAAVVALLIYVFTRRNKRTSKGLAVLGGIMVVCVAVLIIMETGALSGTRFESDDTGTTARVPMLLTALNHAFHHPFGMGVYSVDSDLIVGATGKEFAVVAENTAHNLIGNCAAAYGIIGLVLMLMIYAEAYKNYKRSKTMLRGDNKEYFVAIICLLGLAINAFFHNSYMLNGELSTFIFLGVLFALPNISEKNCEEPTSITK